MDLLALIIKLYKIIAFTGLPPSPPSAPSSITMIDNGPYSGQGNNGRTIHPLGVDVHKNRHKHGLSGSVIAIIVLSASVAVVLCSAVAWVFLFKKTDCIGQPVPTQASLVPSLARPPGKANHHCYYTRCSLVYYSVWPGPEPLREWVD